MIQNSPYPRIRIPRTLTRLSVSAVLLLGGCDQKNYTAEEHIERAKDFTAQGKIKEAQIELRSTLQKAPQNAQAHLLMAEMSMALGNPYLAEVELKKAKESGVAAESVKVDMARAMLMQGRVEDALKEATPREKDSQQNRLRLLDLQSRALLVMGKTQEACAISKNALALQPDSIIAAHSMARCAAATSKNTDEAESYLKKALDKDRNNAESWSLIGGLAVLKNQPQEAIKAYKQAIQIDPLQISTRNLLISLYTEQNNLAEAENLIKEGRKIFPTPVLDYMQAQVEFKRKQYGRAQEALAQALKATQNYMPAIFLNGAVSFALNNHEAAVKDLARYLAQEPGNILARNLLASAYQHLGRHNQALETLAPLLDGKTQTNLATLNLLGRIYISLGQHDKATGYLEKAAAMAPKDSSARTLLGMGLLQAGNTTRALNELVMAAGLDVGDTHPDHLLIAHYMARKEYDRALNAISTLEKKRPSDPDVLIQHGMALFGKKDLRGAQTSLEKALTLRPAYLPAATGLARLDVMRKDFTSARGRLESVLAKNKNSSEAMLALANLAKWQNKDAEYVDWLAKASNADEKNLTVKQLLIEHFLARKENPKALSIANAALNAHPESPTAMLLMARAQLATGEKENALVSYSRLSEMQPKNPDVLHQLGLIQADLKHWQAARASLTKALDLAPNFQPAAEALAILELSQGSAKAAMDVVQRFQKATPKSNAGLVLEGDLLLRQNKVKEATVALRKAYAKAARADLLMKLHNAEANIGNVKEADKLLIAWIKSNPNDTSVRGYYAASLASQKRFMEAIREYESILAKSPNNPFTLNDLAWTYALAGDSRAQATAERALKLHPGNPGIQDTLGWILVSHGQTQAGLKLLEQAAQRLPQATVRYHWIVALAKSGDKAKARKELQTLLDSKVGFPEKPEAMALLDKLH